MDLIQQSTANVDLMFLMLDSADHVTGKTGLSPTVTLSKNGASFAAPSGAVSEVGSGWYKVAKNTTDSNTLGPLIIHATASGADPCDAKFFVVAFDPRDAAALGLSRIDAAVTSRLAPTTAGRTLDVSAGGEAGIDLANVGSPTTTLNLSGTTIGTATNLTNAPTVGDFTTTMKTSITNAVPTAAANASSVWTYASASLGSTSTVGGWFNSLLVALTNRLGPFTGTGDSNVWSYFLALFGKNVAAPADVGGTFDPATDSLEAIREKADTLSTLAAADVRTAVGLASANLDTQLGGISAKTTNLPSSPAAVGSNMNLADGAITANKIAADAITNATLADGALTSSKFSVSTISGPASGILERLTQLWRRDYKKSTQTKSQYKEYADDGSTVIVTQSITDDGTTATKGDAS